MSGKSLKLNIPQNQKIIILILSSNLLFYLLFFTATPAPEENVSNDLIEIKVDARLMTTFQNGKKVTLHQLNSNQSVEALLISPPDEEGLTTVATDIETGRIILSSNNWRIIPPIKLKMEQGKGESREIRY